MIILPNLDLLINKLSENS